MALDIVWTLPGHSRTSGEARDIEAVIERAQIIVSYGLTFGLKHVLLGSKVLLSLSFHNTAHRDGQILDEHFGTVCRFREERICSIDTYLSDPHMVNIFFV